MVTQLKSAIAERADSLFDDGYSIVLMEHEALIINDEGTAYTVDLVFDTCNCPQFAKHGTETPCKHLLGWKKLLADQQADQQARDAAMCEAYDTMMSACELLDTGCDPYYHLDPR